MHICWLQHWGDKDILAPAPTPPPVCSKKLGGQDALATTASSDACTQIVGFILTENFGRKELFVRLEV